MTNQLKLNNTVSLLYFIHPLTVNVSQLPDFPHVSSNCRDLLTGLLRRDPKERITFTQFFDHSFIDLEHVPAPDSLTKAVSHSPSFTNC